MPPPPGAPRPGAPPPPGPLARPWYPPGAPRPGALVPPRAPPGPPRAWSRLVGGPPRPDWRGIIAGLGRGMPGTPAAGAAPPSRDAGARGARCMPCVDENGLLPGRAPPAEGARGPGLGAPPGRGTAGASVAAAGASAAGASAAGASAAGSGFSTTRGPGIGPADFSATGSGASPAGASAGASAFAAAAFLAGLAFLAPWARSASPCYSVRRRTTGASTVEEADFTYSPMSFRVDRTTLLSTPNSRASSWTLTATFLLQGVRPKGGSDH